MEALEAQVAHSISSGTFPGLVLLGSDRSGTLSYSHSAGRLSLSPSRASEQLTPQTVLRLASSTKLVTQVCALQCVERGLIGLDDDVRDVVDDLKQVRLLTGFGGEEGKDPIFEDIKGKITLRNLLTHSSGIAYVPLDPLLLKWREIHNQPPEPRGRFNERFLIPWTAQPDDRWIYSPGLDWAGRVVETLSGQSLEAYIQQNIAKPLGSNSMTFFIQQRPDLLARRADFTKRDAKTGKLELQNEFYHDVDPEDCFGGMGLWATAQDLFDILQSILKDDGRLLRADTLKEAFKPQLNDSARGTMAEFMKNLMYDDWGMGGGFQHHSKRDASLLGMTLVEENENTPRKKGTSAWTGYPNILYFIDPQAGLCGLFAAQVTPPGDPEALKLHIAWEKALYAENERLSPSS